MNGTTLVVTLILLVAATFGQPHPSAPEQPHPAPPTPPEQNCSETVLYLPSIVDYQDGRPEDWVLSNSSNDQDDSDRKRSSAISYHGGPVIGGTLRVYVIWYGNWVSTTRTLLVKSIVETMLSNIGGTLWWKIHLDYNDNAGRVSTGVQYEGSTGFGSSSYRYGSSLSGSNIFSIVNNAIQSRVLQYDTNAVYLVITSADVAQYTSSSYGFCTTGSGYCAWHSGASILNPVGGGYNYLKYAWVGDPLNCPWQCDPQKVSPNGDWAADAMASSIAHELSESVTDGSFNAWYDAAGEEDADKCAWTYGTMLTLGSGASYNMVFGGRNWLIQQLWTIGGYCGITRPCSQNCATLYPHSTCVDGMCACSSGFRWNNLHNQCIPAPP